MPIQYVANQEVMALVRKIIDQCADTDTFTKEELHLAIDHIDRCARCIVALATPDYEAMAVEQREPWRIK